MINLLPYTNKKQLRAARHNIILAKCLGFLLAGIVFLIISCVITYKLLKTDGTTAQQPIAESSITSANQLPLPNEIDNISSELTTAKTIMNSRTSYAEIVTEIGSALPSGAIIDTISINNSSFNQPFMIYIRTKDQNIGQQAKSRLAKSKLFSNPKIINIASAKDSSSDYPYMTTISLKIGNNR